MNLAFSGASNHASGIDNVFWYITAISTVLLVGITIVMIYFVIKYHKSRHPKAEHVHDSMALELTWTIIPTMIVMTMFWYGWVVYRDARKIDPNSMEVLVTGHQWKWEYEYKETKIRRTGKQGLVLAINRPVVLRLKSGSGGVLHAFFVPAFRLKEDVVPGRDWGTYLSFTPTKLGSFDVFCAEYCGGTGTVGEEDGHWSMLSKIHVVTQEEFDRGLKNGGDWRIDGTKPPAADGGRAEAGGSDLHPGLRLLRDRQCFSCHQDEKYAPSFAGLFGSTRTVLTGDQERHVVADEAYLRRSITDPEADITADYYRRARMSPTTDLTEQEMKDVIDYLKQLK